MVCIHIVRRCTVDTTSNRLLMYGFSWNLTFECFSKICQEKSSFIKTWHEDWVLYMKTYVHPWQYLAQSFLEWETLPTQAVEKIKHKIFRKSCLLRDYVENYGTSRQTKDDNIMRRMRFAFLSWITKDTDTYQEYVILIAFPLQKWFHEQVSMLLSHVHCLVCFFFLLPD